MLPYISTGYHTGYQPCYHTFMGVFYRFQRTTIISSLMYRLLYALLCIFSEISTYLHDFQRVTKRYDHFFSKRIILIFFKKTNSNTW